MKTQELLTLIEYNHWANQRVFQRSARLSAEQLAAPGALSHGSLFQTLIHITDTAWSWRLCCQEGQMPITFLSEAQAPDIATLRAFSQAEYEQWIAYLSSLTEEQAGGEIEYSWPRARPRRHPLWQVVMHVVNHSTQHRSEAGIYLAGCGHSPGNIDFIIYTAKHKSEASS